MKYAFKDNADGYYEVELADGESLPDWTEALTPCPVRATPAPNMRTQATEEFKEKREVILGRIVQIAAVLHMTEGDPDFRDALLWLREYVIPLDSHPLVLAAPDHDLEALRAAYVQAYRAICIEALGMAPDQPTALVWKAELDKIFK